MSAPRTTDLRRAGEDVLLDALSSGDPLALAEAYHRTVPAGHAVARRLMTGADQVEALMRSVYARLWSQPPAAGPLEGWVRRTTWALGVEALRASGTAPASPSAAGLVPDLPAPDVRFLDAAERAVAELPDEQRRAVLLAHDKGIPAAEQEPGADEALVQALVALAGPETSASDRDAIAADGCADVPAMGDWCLGLASSRSQADVDAAIEARDGCAAVSRAVRRGRRRIEGLPATPDMGQRILVSVLTTAGAVAAPAAAAPVAPPPDAGPALDVADTVPAPDTDLAGDTDLAADADAAEGTGAAADADGVLVPVDATQPLPPVGLADDGPGDPEAATTADADPFAEPDDPFAEPDDPFADPDDVVGPAGPVADPDDPFAPDPVTDPDDPFAPDPVGDTADLPASAADGPADQAGASSAQDLDRADDQPVDWRPDPGSTAELRLSDILAEGEEEDDPFAGMDDEEPAAPRRGDPYDALRGLGGDGPADPTGPFTAPDTAPPGTHEDPHDDADLIGGYVEGQGHPADDDLAVGAGGRRSGVLASVLAWILPIIGGSLLGIFVAVLVFGAP